MDIGGGDIWGKLVIAETRRRAAEDAEKSESGMQSLGRSRFLLPS